MATHESNPYGVGISREGKHPRVSGYPAYSCWQHMLTRCYDKEIQKRQVTYINCTVCPEWLDYQTFADWFVQQRGHDIGWQIDKDLLASRLNLEDKIYSPETCILLPEEINKSIASTRTRSTNILPSGVHYNNRKTAFVARYFAPTGKNTHIGTYRTVEDAHKAYKEKKQEALDFLTAKYEALLDTKAYNCLKTFYI
jgi:hypothetical protein